MGWIGLSDSTTAKYCPQGLVAGQEGDRAAPPQPLPTRRFSQDQLMTRGSLMLETRLSPDGRPQKLITHRRSHPWRSGFSLHSLPEGGLAVVSSLGEQIAHGVLDLGGAGRTDVLRITYAWDSVAGWGRLTVERPESMVFLALDVAAPPPMVRDDLGDMLRDPLRRSLGADVVYLALSDRIEPVGPMPTLCLTTPIAAQGGYRRAGDLKRGDLVYTSSGELVPVLHAVRRTVPARGQFAPVRLRAPYFDLQQDIIVAPEQRLMITGSEVEYLFGTEAALVPAGHLVNGVSATRCEAHLLVTYAQVVLPRHEAVLAAGSAVESLYIGRLRRNVADLSASILARVPRGDLPEHARSPHCVLKHFEAVTLADHRAA